jgi:predicted HicB family RNase H-like nuclease
MGELRISLPNDLHKQLRRMALDDGTSLKELVSKVLKAYAGQGSEIDNAPEQADDQTV